MEELPLQPNKPAPETELTPADPEKIGDLLLRYELPASEPAPAVKASAEQTPKLVISRDKLKDRIGRYKEQKFSRAKESAPKGEPAEQLTEAHFERRHEIRDETPPETADIQQSSVEEEAPTAPETSVPVPPQTPPAVPPPFMPEQAVPKRSTKIALQPKAFKKPLIFGLVAGTLTAIALIALLIR